MICCIEEAVRETVQGIIGSFFLNYCINVFNSSYFHRSLIPMKFYSFKKALLCN